MLSNDLGIDLGTANVLIYLKGKGIVLNEPSVVALNKNTGKVLAVGEEARLMVGRTPGDIVAIRPLKDGVIADFDTTEAMLTHFIKKLNVSGGFFGRKPHILICCPTSITTVEQNAIREAAMKAGGGHVWLEEEPKVAAIGAGMDIFQPYGNMVIDIGGGTTDVAVLSMGDVVTSASIKYAGNTFDQDIFEYVKKHHRLLIGEHTAERIKIEIGTVLKDGRHEEIDVRGRDSIDGLPKTIKLSSEEVRNAVKDSAEHIIQCAKSVLEKTPPELSADIINRGIMLTGGGALIHGLNDVLTEELHVPVFIAEDALNCVANGTAVLLENHDKVGKRKKLVEI